MDLLVCGYQHNFISSNNPPKSLVNIRATECLLVVICVCVQGNIYYNNGKVRYLAEK